MTPAKNKKMASKTKKLFTNLVNKYAGKWVSVTEDYSNVIAHSNDLDSLISKLKKEETKKGLIIKVPTQEYSAYVG